MYIYKYVYIYVYRHVPFASYGNRNAPYTATPNVPAYNLVYDIY
jgi:hypothetical protein